MNHTAKTFVRFAGIVIGLGAAAWALRARLLPAPEIHEEPPPRFREVADDDPGQQDAGDTASDDLTEIKGIGPVTAGRLSEAGITSFSDLAAADAEAVSVLAGTSESATAKWIEAAGDLS